MKIKLTLLSGLVAATLATPAAATDGYFAHGYGVKSQGMGGVGIALPQDAIAAATNPAGMALIGDRVDVGVTWFRPNREAEISGNAGGSAVNGTYDANGSKDFFIPEFGYNHLITPELSLGVSVYGNGGMNTDYNKPIPLFGTTKAGIDLEQLFIAPTIAWKVTPTQTIGLSLNLAYQRFEAKGLQNFDNPYVSNSPGNVTNNGHDSSTGAGLHIGWIGQVSDAVSLGATYQSKTYMGKFNDYKGLFAENGSFDIPASYGVGLAVKATPQLTLAADVQRILYSDVNSVGNPLSNLTVSRQPLGASNGAGFGWDNVTVVKLGVSYAYSPELTLRGGYNHTTQPIPDSQALFNILAPGVVQDHATLGATWTLPNKGELSFGYMHAFENSVNGTNAIPSGYPYGGGNVKLKMYQDSVGIAYGWKL